MDRKRTLGNCGKVIILGEQSDPALILVHNGVQGILNTELPPLLEDVKNRIFLLQFLLIWKDEHMTMCFQSSENTWYLYDNDPTKPSFEPFLLKSLKNDVICLSGYINITRVKGYYPVYIKAGGPTELCQFNNTCVADSFLAALHTTSIKYSHLEDLFNKNDFFKEVMSLLNNKFYIKARNVFVQELNPDQFNLYGNISDYFPLLRKLVYPDQKQPPNNSSIYNTILRTLGSCGKVIILGERSDPALILVHNGVQGILNTELPPLLEDVKNRIFLLQFLLIWKDEHMTMCFQSSENTWYLYDNDPTKPSFEPLLLESLKNDVICLSGCINITRVKGYYPVTKSKKSTCRLQLLIKNPFPYIKAGGPPELCQFNNTCVADSFLAALHTTSMKYSHLEDLFNKNDFFKEVMSLLNNKFYIKARNVFVQELNPDQFNLYGNISDYFPLLRKLVYPDQKQPPNNSSIYNTILRTLGNCGKVIILVEQSDPALILVHNGVQGILNTELPPLLEDVKNRIFLLQFLLIWKDEHMTMCFQSSENTWYLYDNDPTKPSFEPFLLKSLKNYVICSAGYINITRVKGYYPVTESKNPTCSEALLMLRIGDQGSYMKQTSGLYRFYNTCVPDSLLVSFHILYINHLHVRNLLKCNDVFLQILDQLEGKKYDYARALWIRQLEDFNRLDHFSNIKDHLQIIDKLVSAKVDYHQETTDTHPIYERTLRIFQPFGDVRALGDISDPSLILVHRDVQNPHYSNCLRKELPTTVVDETKRKFELEVLLHGKDRHMRTCFKLTDSQWKVYDNCPGVHFQDTDLNTLYAMKDILICLAIYVNTSQGKHYKQGIHMAKPLVRTKHQQDQPNHQDEDLLKHLGTSAETTGKSVIINLREASQNNMIEDTKLQELFTRKGAKKTKRPKSQFDSEQLKENQWPQNTVVSEEWCAGSFKTSKVNKGAAIVQGAKKKPSVQGNATAGASTNQKEEEEQ